MSDVGDVVLDLSMLDTSPCWDASNGSTEHAAADAGMTGGAPGSAEVVLLEGCSGVLSNTVAGSNRCPNS